MTAKSRKVIAILGGLATFIVIGLTCIFWGQAFSSLADYLSSDATKKIFSNWAFDKIEITNFYLFYLTGLAIALGLTVTFVLWDFNDNFRRRLFIYLPFLILVMGFSTYNYLHFDYIMKPDMQVVFNFLLNFLSLVFIFQLWKLTPKSTDGIILKYYILFLLLLCGFLIPTFFSICWLIERLGLSELNFNFNMPIITTITGVVTTVITVLKYKSDKKKEQSLSEKQR
jgi:hypothetical protein